MNVDEIENRPVSASASFESSREVERALLHVVERAPWSKLARAPQRGPEHALLCGGLARSSTVRRECGAL